MDDTVATDLINDARTFLTSAEWYTARGIPYRRGYLLYGPPGCGKTSFAQAMAGALKLDLCILALSNKSLDDASLAESLRDAPIDAIVLVRHLNSVERLLFAVVTALFYHCSWRMWTLFSLRIVSPSTTRRRV